MVNVQLLMYVLALVCFLLGAAGIESKIGLVALGLAFWVFGILLGGASVLLR